MSLVPWEDQPHGVTDLLRQWHRHIRHPQHYMQPYMPNSALTKHLQDLKSLSIKDSELESIFGEEDFHASIDVQQFKPEELSLKVTPNNTIIIEGKHEEQRDEHGFIFRHFVRKYVLPKNCDVDHVQSRLSSDGVLTITVPKIEENKTMHKHVPIKLARSLRMHAQNQPLVP